MNDREITIKDAEGRFYITFQWEIDEGVHWVKFAGFDEQDDKFFTGFIKWDGCMEIHNFNYHFCHREQGGMLKDIVDLIYETGRDIIGTNAEFD